MTTTSTTAVIAVDCSTTAVKALVTASDGTVLASASSPLETRSPAPGRAEQDARSWWTALDEAVRAALQSLPDRSVVRALCISHQRESFVCLDAAGEPLAPAMLWLDGRAAEQVARHGSGHVEQLCGKPADITPGLYKLAWLRDHHPEVLDRAHRVVDVHGYLVQRLTGRWVTSTASMDPLALLDVETKEYHPDLLAIAGLRRGQLPDLAPVGADLGELLPAVREAWGLAAGTVVVAGLGDGQAAGLGVGVTEPGDAYLVMGTAVVIGAQHEEYRPSRAYRTMVSAFAGQRTLETFSSSGTFLSTWFRREFGEAGADGRPDPALEAAAAAVPVGAEGLLTLPHWNATQTPHWDALSSGAVLGWRGFHTRAHMYRSLLEGIAFELRTQLDGLEEATGRRVASIRAIGGGMRSPLWGQVLADVLGRPLHKRADGEISALGAAVVALTTLGEHPDLASASHALTSFEEVVEPLPENVQRYEALLPLYKSLYPTLRDVLHALHV